MTNKTKETTLLEIRKIIADKIRSTFINENDDALENPENSPIEPTSEPIVSAPEKTPEPVEKEKPNKTYKSRYEDLSPVLKKSASALSDNQLKSIDNNIDDTIKSGKVPHDLTYDYMVNVKKGTTRPIEDYYITALATIYKTGKNQNQIRRAMALILNPYTISRMDDRGVGGDMKPSAFMRRVAKDAGIKDEMWDMRQQKKADYADVISEAVYEGINYAFDNYDPTRGHYFSLALTKAANLTKDKLTSKANQITFQSQKSSLDEPYGGEGGEDTRTGGDDLTTTDQNEMSVEQQESLKLLAEAYKAFIYKKLENNPKYLKVFELIAGGNTLSQIQDIMIAENNKAFADNTTENRWFSKPMIGPEDEKTVGNNVRGWKLRLEEYLTKFIQNGEFQKYIYKATGIPMKLEKFQLHMTGEGGKKEEIKPEEYWQKTGEDPATGEETGEWIDVNKDNGEGIVTYPDNYPALAGLKVDKVDKKKPWYLQNTYGVLDPDDKENFMYHKKNSPVNTTSPERDSGIYKASVKQPTNVHKPQKIVRNKSDNPLNMVAENEIKLRKYIQKILNDNNLK